MLHSRKTRGRESVEQWRRRASQYAARAMRGDPVDCPVEVRALFFIARPASRAADPFPAWKPDCDKLARALGDALEGVVYVADSRIVRWTIEKRWASEGEEPSTDVTVWALASA